MFRRFMITCAAIAILAAGAAAEEKTVMVGGAPMYPSKDIIDNAINSKDHTTLVAAVKAAGLVGTLKGIGPFTVFAPTNAAFEKLPAGTVDMLLRPDHLDALKAVLTYHVVPGRIDSKMLKEMARKGKGAAELKTVSGDTLWIAWKDGKLWLRDGKGTTAAITTADVYQSNGVIHVIDTVVMAK
ncbi:MAG TPA: fasciclin domain-containing protein [Vicinamibacterales bacterium]|nr:fasciclin domain-containing protein [Vicinamibacterales bacterium]